MAKKARLPINPTPPPQRPAWIGFAVTCLIAAACGAAISAAVLPRAAAPQAVAAPAPPISAPTPAPVTAPAPSASVTTTPTANTGAPANAAVSAVPAPDLVLDVPPAKAALNLANWSYDHQNWTAAIAYYSEAIKRGENNPDVLTDMGNAYRFSNQPQKALAQYFLAQQKSPAHETSLFNEGGIYADYLGDTKKAVDVWKEYLKRFPNGVHHEQASHLIEITEAHSGVTTSNAPNAPTQ